jgi:predicted ATP-grasp superfamily ATP-dependent carboligase
VEWKGLYHITRAYEEQSAILTCSGTAVTSCRNMRNHVSNNRTESYVAGRRMCGEREIEGSGG